MYIKQLVSILHRVKIEGLHSLGFLESTKFRTDEKGHELKAYDSFFYAEKLLVFL